MIDLAWDNQTDTSINKEPVLDHLDSVLRHLGHADKVSLEVLLVGEEEITKLNLKHFNQNNPTDVLSFPVPSNISLESGFAGSIAICDTVATAQAKTAGITPTQEITTLASHGLLHLLGYNHR